MSAGEYLKEATSGIKKKCRVCWEGLIIKEEHVQTC